MDAIELLLRRNSSAKLTEPAPTEEALQTMLAAASRAPDHGWIRPWRFLSVRGDARLQLGELFAAAAEKRDPELTEEALAKFRKQPLRAPLILVVYAQISAHPKVPEIEQKLTVGCAAQGLLLAAEALGYAGIWRTGVNAYDQTVKTGLGLSADDAIIGFIYLGTRDGGSKLLPELKLEEYLTAWGTQ
ncbi:nitroreductase [Spongiibacter sp. IMCC21906]|uniref:nitroreductase family protein n=1 Tax=Spongiibacter sp. IMCC21906 TaxID=1620392 RepID=UPI00062DD8B3|nr:nitroreductase [Spongiibacter sp. IMCC21906]AKH70182.1 nitroreductase [Spongiibacter sp. IMCC21906]